MLDRDTGTPVLPVEERPVPQSTLAGERTSPTQPIPTSLPPLTPVRLDAGGLWGPTQADRDACAKMLGPKGASAFTPPSLEGGVAVPGNIGGMNWSGYAFDPQRKLLVVNTTVLPFQLKMLSRTDYVQRGPAEHGEYAAQRGTPYAMYRRPLMSPSHLPCTAGPWGELVGVDLARERIAWRVPLGSMQSFAPELQDLPPGSPSLGGPIVTAGGLAFVAGTIDPHLRAFDLDSGTLLWQADLPTSGHATPMTYAWQGRQYVVIAAGGSAVISEEARGDAIIAYALPQTAPHPAR